MKLSQNHLHMGFRNTSDCGTTHLRQQKIQEGPELPQLILERRSCEQQPPGSCEAIQILGQLALAVLHSLGFVYDDVLPVHLYQPNIMQHFQRTE